MIKMKIYFSIHDDEDFVWLIYGAQDRDSFSHEDFKCTDFILFMSSSLFSCCFLCVSSELNMKKII